MRFKDSADASTA